MIVYVWASLAAWGIRSRDEHAGKAMSSNAVRLKMVACVCDQY